MMKGKDYISGNHSKFLIRYGAELSRQSCRERAFWTDGTLRIIRQERQPGCRLRIHRETWMTRFTMTGTFFIP